MRAVVRGRQIVLANAEHFGEEREKSVPVENAIRATAQLEASHVKLHTLVQYLLNRWLFHVHQIGTANFKSVEEIVTEIATLNFDHVRHRIAHCEVHTTVVQLSVADEVVEFDNTHIGG